MSCSPTRSLLPTVCGAGAAAGSFSPQSSIFYFCHILQFFPSFHAVNEFTGLLCPHAHCCELLFGYEHARRIFRHFDGNVSQHHLHILEGSAPLTLHSLQLCPIEVYVGEKFSPRHLGNARTGTALAFTG
jgi:hypothetical protein